jgi:SAM-dependent methyltransferase
VTARTREGTAGTTALAAWRRYLADWAIPAPILAAAPEPPWTAPRAVFERRTRRLVADPDGATYRRSRAALTGTGTGTRVGAGTVLDVGAGAGATSLPLAPLLTGAVAVDPSGEMLAAYARAAADLGVPASIVSGRWPDVALSVAPADLVVCGNVLYNVPDLADFATALTSHAYRRVVVEITARHPMSTLNPLWRRFHGIRRPSRPTAADAVAALRELGLDLTVDEWRSPAAPDYGSLAEVVDSTRRRLCLPPPATDEIRAALVASGWPRTPPREMVTLSWPGTAVPDGAESL